MLTEKMYSYLASSKYGFEMFSTQTYHHLHGAHSIIKVFNVKRY